MVMDIIAQVHTFFIIFNHAWIIMICLIQILLSAMKTMVAVNRYAPTLKEAMNVLVEMATH